jgi:hypothetical protein
MESPEHKAEATRQTETLADEAAIEKANMD